MTPTQPQATPVDATPHQSAFSAYVKKDQHWTVLCPLDIYGAGFNDGSVTLSSTQAKLNAAREEVADLKRRLANAESERQRLLDVNSQLSLRSEAFKVTATERLRSIKGHKETIMALEAKLEHVSEGCQKCGYDAWRVSVETGTRTCAVCDERDQKNDFQTDLTDMKADRDRLAARVGELERNRGEMLNRGDNMAGHVLHNGCCGCKNPGCTDCNLIREWDRAVNALSPASPPAQATPSPVAQFLTQESDMKPTREQALNTLRQTNDEIAAIERGGRVAPSREENPNGLHGKYIIRKADGSPTDPRAFYFVLRLDGHGRDIQHIIACRAAALTYAASAPLHMRRVAEELRAAVHRMSVEAPLADPTTTGEPPTLAGHVVEWFPNNSDTHHGQQIWNGIGWVRLNNGKVWTGNGAWVATPAPAAEPGKAEPPRPPEPVVPNGYVKVMDGGAWKWAKPIHNSDYFLNNLGQVRQMDGAFLYDEDERKGYRYIIAPSPVATIDPRGLTPVLVPLDHAAWSALRDVLAFMPSGDTANTDRIGKALAAIDALLGGKGVGR